MSTSRSTYQVAAVQAAPAFLDLDAGVTRSVELIAEAARHGASLIAFPEAYLPGYPFHVWVDSPAQSLRFTRRYVENSLHYDSPQADRLAAAARDHDIVVVMGHSERSGGSLYLAQWLIDRTGRTIARRRKLKPTHVERAVYGEGDGSDLAVHTTGLGRLGALCCWEHLQPLSKYAMYAQDEQVHVAAWPSFSLYPDVAYALGAEVNTSASRVYAVEGGCFVVAPCAVVSPEMVDLLCLDDAQRELLHPGGGYARIYGPDGQQLGTTLDPEVEGLVYADIDLGDIAVAKAAADPAGHYSRPDVTRLWLDRSTRERVVHVGGAAGTVRAEAPDEGAPREEVTVADLDDLPAAGGAVVM